MEDVHLHLELRDPSGKRLKKTYRYREYNCQLNPEELDVCWSSPGSSSISVTIVDGWWGGLYRLPDPDNLNPTYGESNEAMRDR